MKELRVCAYCRVSTDNEEQEKSYESQRSYFLREITQKGHYLVEVYGDEGESGTLLNNRADFNRMIFDAGIDIIESFNSNAKKNRYGNIDKRLSKKRINYELSDRESLFDEIWIKNTSRFARNTLVSQIIDLLKKKNVYIYFIDQNLNTRDSNELLLKLFQLFDENDSRDKSAKVRFGMKESAKTRETILSNGMLYGYEFKRDTNSLTAIGEEANNISLIYNLYLNGLGFRRIINQLNEKNIKARNGKPFVQSSIRRILTNEKYYGENVRNKYTYGEVFNKYSYAQIREEKEWIVKSNHPRIEKIIDKKTFDAVRAKMKTKVSHINQRGLYKGTSEYAGLIYCGSCGSVYYSNNDEGRKFFNCCNKKHHGIDVCSNPNITLKKLVVELGKEEIKFSFLIYIEKYSKILDKLVSILKSKLSNNEGNEVIKLGNYRKDLYQKKDKYIELYTDGIINKEEFKRKIDPINVKLVDAQRQIDIVGMSNAEVEKRIEDVMKAKMLLKAEKLRLFNEVDNSIGLFDDNGIVRNISKIVVQYNGSIEVQCKFMDNIKGIVEEYNNQFKEILSM